MQKHGWTQDIEVYTKYCWYDALTIKKTMWMYEISKALSIKKEDKSTFNNFLLNVPRELTEVFVELNSSSPLIGLRLTIRDN